VIGGKGGGGSAGRQHSQDILNLPIRHGGVQTTDEHSLDIPLLIPISGQGKKKRRKVGGLKGSKKARQAFGLTMAPENLRPAEKEGARHTLPLATSVAYTKHNCREGAKKKSEKNGVAVRGKKIIKKKVQTIGLEATWRIKSATMVPGARVFPQGSARKRKSTRLSKWERKERQATTE